eukprot:m.47426 g.47426  ORF g.47426 m.47426 type:complete len:202 (-) comp11272_c1_seq1:28-633(-)
MAAKGILRASNAVMLLCDMQTKFVNHIQYFRDIAQASKRLLDASAILEVPVIASEHVSSSLGATIPELEIGSRKNVSVYEKNLFSMNTDEFKALYKPMQATRNAVILMGIESHVCVMQTALDLVQHVDVHVVADAVSSRTQHDRLFALKRMRQSGVFITTTESVIFQLMGGATHPGFKKILPLVRTPLAPQGLAAAPPSAL